MCLEAPSIGGQGGVVLRVLPAITLLLIQFSTWSSNGLRYGSVLFLSCCRVYQNPPHVLCFLQSSCSRHANSSICWSHSTIPHYVRVYVGKIQVVLYPHTRMSIL